MGGKIYIKKKKKKKKKTQHLIFWTSVLQVRGAEVCLLLVWFHQKKCKITIKPSAHDQ